jgi:nucleoside-diphosphate-sugar epimerase
MKVLVTGGAGYIGSVLTRTLIEKGNEVTCLDRLFFGIEPIQDLIDLPEFTLIRDDTRWFDPEPLSKTDAVVDLAALSNDPSGELNPRKTYEINHEGRARVARLSKKHGVDRYLLASSCSVYGSQGDSPVDETSKVNPSTAYAEASLQAEGSTLALSDHEFTVTALRLATAYGISPRMRFDLAINAMTLGQYKSGVIPVMRDGRQRRPFIHVQDIAHAIATVIQADPDTVANQVINTGSNQQNYQILDLAREIGGAVKRPFEIEWYGDVDKRSYRVNFDKIQDILNFEPAFRPEDGAKEIFNALAKGELKDSARTRTVQWYRKLLESQELREKMSLHQPIL